MAKEENFNLDNYKGVFYNQDTGEKFHDKVTGAHFEYFDMVARLKKLQKEREGIDKNYENQNRFHFPKETVKKLAPAKELRNEVQKVAMYNTVCKQQPHKETSWKSKENTLEEHKKRNSESNRQTKSITSITNTKEVKINKKAESHYKKLSDLSKFVTDKERKRTGGEKSNRSKSIEKSSKLLEAKANTAKKIQSYFTTYVA